MHPDTLYSLSNTFRSHAVGQNAFRIGECSGNFLPSHEIIFERQTNVAILLDDTLLHTRSWEDNVLGLHMPLTTLRNHGLTVNPCKLVIGQTPIEFLGHPESNGTLAPIASHVSKNLHLKAPSTKKQRRNLMGLISHYRAFIPKFSSITSPLTDLLRKGNPDKIIWSSDKLT
ncbi:reverse transcriptase [Elysia marginata]|uniref:Reverse transcriptase n=1 Tax=Elysia marginata TaxID=1093978 RepID=A0AAV4F8M7_9GAST|nr:reverse transcriptase [Elysia marginata]